MDWSIARERRSATLTFWCIPPPNAVSASQRGSNSVDDGFRYLLSEKLAGIVIGTEMLSGIDAAQARFFAAPKSYYPPNTSCVNESYFNEHGSFVDHDELCSPE
jgi:hypothetical protein